MADSLVNMTLAVHQLPATVAERLLKADERASSLEAQQRIVREVSGLIARDAKVLVRVDSVTRGASAGTVVVDQSNCVAGDLLRFRVPGRAASVDFVAVATDAEVTAVPGTGLWSIETASDDTTGEQLAAAINAHPIVGARYTAVNASGTVTITAKALGSWADATVMGKVVGTSAALTITAFAGGDDVLDQPTMTVTFGTPDIAADDTISIGARVYTWKASASADGEITLSTTPATAATNFAAAVNADTNLTGIVTASVNSAVVTLTFVGDPRLSKHIALDFTETNAGSVVLGGVATGGATSETPSLGTTVTGYSTTRTISGRGAA